MPNGKEGIIKVCKNLTLNNVVATLVVVIVLFFSKQRRYFVNTLCIRNIDGLGANLVSNVIEEKAIYDYCRKTCVLDSQADLIFLNLLRYNR